jgi:hypothetical protein
VARGTDHTQAVWFHVLGILDLIVAGSIGFLLIRLIEVTPSTAPLLVLPLALIPTVPVPLALALHIVSLRRLRIAAWSEEDRDASVEAPAEQSPRFSHSHGRVELEHREASSSLRRILGCVPSA